MLSRPTIKKDLLPINQFSRPARELVSVKGIVVHWAGNPNADAEGQVKYFKNLANQNPDDSKYDRYAGAHYFVGTEGNIIQTIPDNEMAYHVGAKEYQNGILDKFNTTYPNNCLIGVEMCHPDWGGEFTENTWTKTVHLVAYLIEQYDLTLSDVVRHYDVTGKNCPKWFVEHEDEYEKFRNDIQTVLSKSVNYDSIVKNAIKNIKSFFPCCG